MGTPRPASGQEVCFTVSQQDKEGCGCGEESEGAVGALREVGSQSPETPWVEQTSNWDLQEIPTKEEPGEEPTGQEVASSYPNHFQITGRQPPLAVTRESEGLEFKSYLCRLACCVTLGTSRTSVGLSFPISEMGTIMVPTL